MSPVRLLLLTLPLLALLAAPSTHRAAADELVRVNAQVGYAVQPDVAPIHVSWQVSLQNNDPRTVNQGGGTIAFYDSYPLPILRGATDISALSPSGTPLSVTQDDSTPGPLVTATVGFDRMLFYQDSYSFSLDYDLPAAREESLLVTPYYIFLPLIASGDDVTVTVSTPAADSAWQSVLEPVDCARSGDAFTCAGSKSVYLAAFAEV
ncbi:MAG TPA: hypothetical protein VFT91_10840, partial [Dehalococcoidia bacterium]|nr:hypothetical protein [Dehalococcoidia bacterium]